MVVALPLTLKNRRKNTPKSAFGVENIRDKPRATKYGFWGKKVQQNTVSYFCTTSDTLFAFGKLI